MGLTALQLQMQDVRGKGPPSTPADNRTGDYRGATSVARFSDPQAEYFALQSGSGVHDLGFRALISLTGGDRVRWLNGMVTNNIRDLASGHGVYAFLLNPQGHILGDLHAYNREDSITIETDRSQLEKILATFDHYIIMDDVEVANLSEQLTVLGISGSKARAVLRAAGIAIPDMKPLQILDATCDCDCVKCTVVRGEDADNESYELWLAPSEVRKTWDALVAQGATPVGFEALEMQRIASGVPLYGVDIRERDLPQETEQARALNFNKGCYVGQEIVERIRSRGAVHRKLTGFVVGHGSHVAVGAKIAVSGKDVGEITSVTSLPLGGHEKTVALGYIRREIGVPGREVEIGEAKAIVTELPFREPSFMREEVALEHDPA
jgi:folate-binding protein YgfZ